MPDSEFKIEKGVPVPLGRHNRGGACKYPWNEMEPGDSFFVPGRALRNFNIVAPANRRYAPKRFVARTVKGGVRVWRIDGLGENYVSAAAE